MNIILFHVDLHECVSVISHIIDNIERNLKFFIWKIFIHMYLIQIKLYIFIYFYFFLSFKIGTPRFIYQLYQTFHQSICTTFTFWKFFTFIISSQHFFAYRHVVCIDVIRPLFVIRRKQLHSGVVVRQNIGKSVFPTVHR